MPTRETEQRHRIYVTIAKNDASEPGDPIRVLQHAPTMVPLIDLANGLANKLSSVVEQEFPTQVLSAHLARIRIPEGWVFTEALVEKREGNAWVAATESLSVRPSARR